MIASKFFRRLEAVGADGDYQSRHALGDLLIFFGYGSNYFGELKLHQLFFVVLEIWALQLIVSLWWLSHFRCGPPGMAVAEPDVLEAAAVPEGSTSRVRGGRGGSPGS